MLAYVYIGPQKVVETSHLEEEGKKNSTTSSDDNMMSLVDSKYKV